VIDVEQLDAIDAGLVELLEILGRNLVTGLDVESRPVDSLIRVERGIAAEDLPRSG
jgi:hypothetical protein